MATRRVLVYVAVGSDNHYAAGGWSRGDLEPETLFKVRCSLDSVECDIRRIYEVALDLEVPEEVESAQPVSVVEVPDEKEA